ncbi:T9SS type A sorting domain-containing protein [Pedobacter cryophilus]|uniref:T9SS type A sorting domain-containing protein n=1 Tax=Pedobacter cryophilus TaxID=2571271 RepID=A0A4U1C0L1_9SPHI|nr:T9SS type A sorting domain-containing protein [Pedobacter cryophilus]TKB99052.1 T9SS type A sorting domain-containing protein [Pedobacter cryophilus]
MKNLFALFIVKILMISVVAAQQIKIASNARLRIAAGTSLIAGNLTFKPTTALTLSGINVLKSATVSNSFADNYVRRVYNLTTTPFLFSGEIKFKYDEAELNGLNESMLKLFAYNGTSWEIAGTSSNNTVGNIVTSSNIMNQNLSEIILANESTLPLKWRMIEATRIQTSVKVEWQTEQEINVKNFDLQRSIDGITWINAKINIPAKNQSNKQQYIYYDEPDFLGTVYYRVKQIDVDGHFSFSNIASASPTKVIEDLLIFPNPTKESFSISGISKLKIENVKLFNNSGSLVTIWKSQDKYNINLLPTGSYNINIQILNGPIISKKLIISN